MRIRIIPAAALLAASMALPAVAQTFYKLIDKNGKVTYSESPPKDFDGKVIRVDVDPKANTATLPKAPPAQSTPPPGVRAAAKATVAANRSDAARDKLAAAQRALQDAIDNPREDEVTRVGTKSGFTRPVPTEDYQKRLDALREDVRLAEEELRVAEGR